MRRFLLIAGLVFASAVQANDIEVVGQFVVAPIDTEECQASATTMPTAQVLPESELFDMLTFLMNDNPDGIKQVSASSGDEEIVAVYSLSGQKQEAIKRGINIVVNAKGNARKMIVR